MITAYVVMALAFIWAVLRFRRGLANQSVFRRVKKDQFIVGNGFMRARYDENEFLQLLFGSRFEYVNPMEVIIDIDKETGDKTYRENGNPIPKEVGFFHLREWEDKK